MNTHKVRTFLLAAFALPSIACGQAAVDPDPNGVLRKPISDRLIVLTFDDGCASGYTVIAPVLKSMGFIGSFYVCDFDSFNTRKDWYLTWRQMQALAAGGFEIGNHTVGHGGGLENYLRMEDELLANGVPKPTTVCWPVYAVAWPICPDLTANGYTFGRGGHERPYRPTVDNPFDVPSFTIHDGVPVETFIKHAQQACQGRVVVYCFHGVPDMEHAAVGLKPATFKVMMQYLKDNRYQCIAMRDLATYIDPAKAAKLPPTIGEVKDAPPFMSLKDDHPYVPVAKENHPVTEQKAPVSTAKDMLTFVLPAALSAAIAGTRIGAYVSADTDLKALAPTFTLSPLATAAPTSGTARDFAKPQTYAVTAQDGSTKVYTVTVVRSDQPSVFTWSKAEGGKWSDAANWANTPANRSGPLATGRADYILSFVKPGTYAVTNDLSPGFQLHQLELNAGQGQGLTVAGNSMAFTANSVNGPLPAINELAIFSRDQINAPLNLTVDVAVNLVTAGQLVIGGLISGPGRLIYTGGNGNASGDLNGGPNQHYSNLSLNNPANTYSGGTVVKGGTLRLAANTALGTGPLTLNDGTGLALGSNDATNPLILNGGTIDAGGVNWNAPITLNGNTRIAGHNVNFNKSSGSMSGPGGFTEIGTWGAFGRTNVGGVHLWGDNTYAGPTIVQQGALYIEKATALYHANPADWTPSKITVHPAATLAVSAGGQGEFTGTQVGTLLKNLTSSINDNGLLAGAVFCVDTTNAREPVAVASNVSDSKGAGGGPFCLRKCGAGTLQLAGTNTYTGPTRLEGGTLSVVSLNSVAKGRPSSSLGAPADVESGEIVLGSGDGEVALVYIGTGETSDRVMNLAGRNATVTFGQSGTGLWKLASTFVISGYGANKIIQLRGDTAGTGELAGNIANPFDRTGKATTSLTKSGRGTWTLSGANSYSGLTKVIKGTLSLANAFSLGDKTDVEVSEGATLELNFKGEMRVSKLTLGDKPQPTGTYSAASTPKFIRGTGLLKY